MDKRQSVSQNVSFYWVPEAFPVRWAYTPEEVPPWDITRGFPCHAPAGFNPDVRLQLEEADDVEKPVFIWSIPQPTLKTPKNIDDVDKLRVILSEHPAYKERAADWQPLPPPADGYPRLVRNSFTTNALGYFYRDDVDVLTILPQVLDDSDKGAPISRPKMKEIERLASFLGAPEKLESNTLASWLGLIWWLKGHLEVMEGLQLCGLEEVRERASEHEVKYDYQGKLPLSVGERTMALVWRDMYQPAYRASDIDEFRLLVAFKLHLNFRHQVSRAEPEYPAIVPSHKNFNFEGRFNLKAWATFCLSKEWLNPRLLRRCEGCGYTFVASRRDAMYCRPRCRTRVFERNRGQKTKQNAN